MFRAERQPVAGKGIHGDARIGHEIHAARRLCRRLVLIALVPAFQHRTIGAGLNLTPAEAASIAAVCLGAVDVVLILVIDRRRARGHRIPRAVVLAYGLSDLDAVAGRRLPPGYGTAAERLSGLQFALKRVDMARRASPPAVLAPGDDTQLVLDDRAADKCRELGSIAPLTVTETL